MITHRNAEKKKKKKAYMQLRAARSRWMKFLLLRYSIPRAISVINFTSICDGRYWNRHGVWAVFSSLSQQRAAQLTYLRIVVSWAKIQPLLFRNTFRVFTHLDVLAFFRNLVLFEPVLPKMAVSYWQIGKNLNPEKHPIQQQIKLQTANNDLSVCVCVGCQKMSEPPTMSSR